MIRIFIARHGETTWNAEGKIQGWSDPDLSPLGYCQSLALLEHLKDRPLKAIYSSPLRRSYLTAQPIADHLGLPVLRQPELKEIGFGILEEKNLFQFDETLKQEWNRFKQDRFSYRIPGAENYSDVANRLRPFVERVLRQHQEEEILIVGHRVVNRLLIGMFLEIPLEETVKIEQTNDCLYLVERNGEKRVFHYLDGEVREGFLPVRHDVSL
ncbi:MAG: histidine phosphatase family protein [Desulfobacterota bacterium]|nr:histidine phosphatase family protein [Thermodesulfobacteriota bacterium]